MNTFIDIHAHYHDEAFEPDRLEVIRRQFEGGVRLIVDPAVDLGTSLKVIELARQFDNYYCCAGIHPHQAGEATPDDYAVLRGLCAPGNAGVNKIVAIGETGLDYHYDFAPRTVQADNFRQNIRLALECGLPLVVHDREAHRDTLDILLEEHAFDTRVLFHCYSGSAEFAQELVGLGCMFSFGGAVTFKNARKFEDVFRVIPLDRLLPETDSPYMAPVPVRGTRNTSLNLEYIYPRLACLAGVDAAELPGLLEANAARFFGISF